MILVSAKAMSNEASPISLNSSEEKKSTLSFADLLKGVNYKKDVKEEFLEKQQGKSDSQTKTLLSLLKNPEETPLGQFGLNPKITQNLTPSEFKTLVSDAKKYLESQIKQTEGYKRSEMEGLPKTLKGLVASAKEFGVDLSKITLEEVQLKTKSSFSRHAKDIQDIKQNSLDNDAKNGVQDLRSTPLFKAQESQFATTQQIVQLKQFKPEEKISSEKAQDSLRALLRGDKEGVQQISVTTPLSVEAAKVLTVNEDAKGQRTLESLLRQETSHSPNNEISVKTEGAPKAESLEVKIGEAKQMIKYLSSDIKNTIEEYKSPFTRVKLQLNPQRLGEVDVTVVQRGNNLHVNLSSNNAAINTLALHQGELRQQLQNSGINNASFNFNSQSGNGEGAQNDRQRQDDKGHKAYRAFAEEEAHEEIISSLEIIVPRYT